MIRASARIIFLYDSFRIQNIPGLKKNIPVRIYLTGGFRRNPPYIIEYKYSSVSENIYTYTYESEFSRENSDSYSHILF